MLNLVYAVISISLFALFLYAQTQYVSTNKQMVFDKTDRYESYFTDIKKGFDDYVAATGLTPSALTDFTPDYAFMPPTPGTSMAWSFGSGGPGGKGRYICLSGQMNDLDLGALERLKTRLSAQAFFLDTQYCGVRVHTTTPVANGGLKPVAATLWLKWGTI